MHGVVFYDTPKNLINRKKNTKNQKERKGFALSRPKAEENKKLDSKVFLESV